MELIDLNLILEALKQLYDSTPSATFVWELIGEPIPIMAERTQMNRLFTNLIQNALQAVPDDKEGLILVQQEIKDGKIFTKVKDNGSGISEVAREKIFVPNFTTKSAGTGLGLAMSKRIVEQSNGEISFETSPAGTSFCVWFPLA
jgi:signal transduction histidine kinase